LIERNFGSEEDGVAMIQERRSAAEWWRCVTARGRFVAAVVIGPRQSGKSSWFGELAADPAQNVVLWRAMSVARKATTDEVWHDLWKVLGMPAHLPGDDPLEHLELVLDDRARPLTLVVDDWDRAVDGRGVTVSDACYEVLDTLSRFCLEQIRHDARKCYLGLALLTSLPDTSDLQYFAKDAQRATFERLSQLVTRSFIAERFPLLDREESEGVLVAAGLSRRDARKVASACGGWLRLLLKAAEVARGHEGTVAGAITEVCEEHVPGLLKDAVYDWLAKRPEVSRDPREYLETQLAEGRAPARFGLPHRFDDPARVAPVIQRALRRTFLVVDTENIYVPFSQHAEREPSAYAPDGVVRHVQKLVGRWLGELCARHEIDDDDVYFIGVRPERIDNTVGPATAGHRRPVSDLLLDKQRRTGELDKGHTDDSLLTGLVGERAGRYPLAEIVLVTGDMDAPMLLEPLRERIWVAAPWTVSRKLREVFAGTGRLSENGLGVPRPGSGGRG
jgi:hypothetical protein